MSDDEMFERPFLKRPLPRVLCLIFFC